VKGVAGTWKDLTDNVNFMAGNLTGQVRGIAKVVTAVANGDLKQKLTVEAKGEIAELADTINSMIDTLATFADQVTTVAREVGVEGKLGGQAKVPGRRRHVEGPDRQREPARRQPDHAGARDRRSGDRRDQGRPDAVDHGRGAGRGRGAEGQHQRDDPQPADTTQKNTEQDWLKTNLAKFSRMLQGQRDLLTVGR
jgi:HAMP domain-containing protein